MKSLVLFDLDGTLIDSIQDLTDSTNYALAECSLPLHSVEEYKYFVGNSVDPLIRRALPEGERDNQALFEQVKKIYLNRYAAHSKDKTRPYPGIEKLLAQCNESGVLIAVVSNKPHDITADVVRYYFPKICFAATIGQKEGIPQKPDPAGVREVLRLTSTSPSDALYVGDTWVDMQTAQNSGLQSCGVLWGFRTRQELEEHHADFIVADAEGLAKIIFG
ncbi:MAG: HAD family hydrolase [Oscillospiraceae bacterium]|nr:HAD family hydrolase [Oscillospiraceae bacterium]